MTPPIWIDNSQEVQPKFKNMGTFKEDKPNGDGLNLLFSGCSITANVGLKDCPNGGWSSYLFEKIKKELKVSSVNNCSISGASTFEIISNVLRFLNLKNKPDIVFLLLPPVQREMSVYAKEIEAARVLDYNMFSILNNYCKKNNIVLIATTWDFYIEGVTSWFVSDGNKLQTMNLFKEFDSFFVVDMDQFKDDVFEFSMYGSLSLEGADSHPSEVIHMAYAKMFYEEWKKINETI